MPRPSSDPVLEKEKLLTAAEQLIKKRGAPKLTVSEVAAACGMSQSNAYRYFPSKADLINAIIARWFETVETELAKIVGEIPSGDADPEDLLRRFIRCVYRVKRDAFDEDPDLYQSYLTLAADHMQTVSKHVHTIHLGLIDVTRFFLEQEKIQTPDLTSCVTLIEDITVMFRDPRIIATRRPECTEERLDHILDFLIAGIKRNKTA